MCDGVYINNIYIFRLSDLTNSRKRPTQVSACRALTTLGELFQIFRQRQHLSDHNISNYNPAQSGATFNQPSLSHPSSIASSLASNNPNSSTTPHTPISLTSVTSSKDFNDILNDNNHPNNPSNPNNPLNRNNPEYEGEREQTEPGVNFLHLYISITLAPTSLARICQLAAKNDFEVP